MVFYRKYRPQQISDLDSTSVRETLQVVIKKEIPHAFLFTGPKGLGKTSTARIVAKAVNCEKRAKGEIEPCNACEQCKSITAGTNMDVLEIDAASNRGIDEIRDLKEKIRLAPVSSKMKVYIIDEVHMLTTEAFNALLKTLEEPPDHAMFILATTEPHKVPATIMSRCFHINFNRATDEEIVRSLKRVVAGEKLSIEDDVLFAVARMADGGFRDAVKLLEELVLLAGDKKITKDLLESSYKSTNLSGHVSDLLIALKKNDTKKGLEVVGAVVNQGMDVKYFTAQVIEELHQMILAQYGIKQRQTENREAGFSSEEISVLVALLSKAYQETKFAVVAQLPLELAIIEWCQSVIPSEADGSHSSDHSSNSGVGDPSTRRSSSVGMTKNEGVTVSSLRKHIGDIKKKEALYGAPKKVKEEGVTIETTTVELQHTSGDGEITAEWLDHFWKSLIAEMKNHNHTAAGVLRSCSIKHFDKKQLVIVAAYTFHKERLEEIKTLQALETVCKMLTGKTVEVTIELKRSN